jgi:Spy/CpxP family protein refolding chaperone
MRKRIALLLVGLSTAAVVSLATPPANAANPPSDSNPMMDTNWPCRGC